MDVEGDPVLLRLILAQVKLGVLVTDAQRRIMYINETFTQETGYGLSEVFGRPCSFLQGPGTNPADVRRIREALGACRAVQQTLLNYRKDGSELLYHLSITPITRDGELQGFIGIQQDVTLLVHTQQALERAALTDGLTGLGNRRAFDQRLEEAQEAGKPFALLIADLNFLKQVNDQQGHLAGDQLLQLVARQLTSRCAPEERAFRLGGDEFAVFMLPGADQPLTVRLAAWHDELRELQQTVSFSVGLARFPEDHPDVWEVFRTADLRMYAHKTSSR
jgi:diguanylate cyclase (GGDEF)-like protein/PAS domain S-box-containing protein